MINGIRLLLLQFLAREIGKARLLIVATYRDVELRRQHPLSETLGELSRLGSTRVVLRGLEVGDVGNFIARSANIDPPTALVDAVYRETPRIVDEWRGMGASIVNMEVAAFYAAAKACGIRALWLGHVSDILIGDWEDWYVDRRDMTAGTIDNCLAVLCDMD